MANYSKGYFLVTYGVELEIDTTPQGATRTWEVLGDGITNFAEALNEVKQQMYYLVNKGFGQTEITGMHPAFTITGHRLKGDKAQDFIFANKYKMGEHRKTTLNVKVLNASNSDIIYDTYQCDITFCDLQEFSGSTENGSDISITLELNGSPEKLVNAPVITVVGNNTAEARIEMRTATEHALIYYTTDGSDPTPNSNIYSGIITDNVAGAKVYKAIACMEGYADSEIKSANVVITNAPALP